MTQLKLRFKERRSFPVPDSSRKILAFMKAMRTSLFVSAISYGTGLSERTVRRHLHALRARGRVRGLHTQRGTLWGSV